MTSTDQTLDGHLLKVLRALDSTTPGCPATEDDVYLTLCRSGHGEAVSYYRLLGLLSARGLATRCDVGGGRGSWYITDKGREALP